MKINELADMSEIFWMLCSVLVMPIEQQIQVIGGLPDSRQSKQPYITNSFLFATSLERYMGSWGDEFDFFYDIDEQAPASFCNDCVEAICYLGESDCYSKKEFMNHRWQYARKIGATLLKQAELPAIPCEEFDTTIDFNKLVRVFINEDGFIQVD